MKRKGERGLTADVAEGSREEEVMEMLDEFCPGIDPTAEAECFFGRSLCR